MQHTDISVYPVYILSRVAEEIFQQCVEAVPHETLGRLLGYRYLWQGKSYTKVVDWVSGTLDSSNIHAQFTPQGIRECELFLDERYGNNTARPVEIGLFHSHPFHCEPHFSSIDLETFLTFPYDEEGNVFILIDPLAYFFKVFVIASKDRQKYLHQVAWMNYCPRI
jgi:proteasome lid subunit RPN8/RPN11